MTVDYLVKLFSSMGDFPALFFLLAAIISAIPMFLFMAIYALVVIYAELKVSSFMQDKIGPMGQGVGLHAGKWGLLQPVADALKLLLKEDIIPAAADKKIIYNGTVYCFYRSFCSISSSSF